MPHNLVIQHANVVQISFVTSSHWPLNIMFVLCYIKCEEFHKVSHYQKEVNLIPVSQVLMLSKS